MSVWDPQRMEQQAKQRRLDQERKQKEQAIAKKRKKAQALANAERKKKWLELKKKHSADTSSYDFKNQEYQSEYGEPTQVEQKKEVKISRGFGSLDTKGIKKLSAEEGADGKNDGSRNFASDANFPKLPRPV